MDEEFKEGGRSLGNAGISIVKDVINAAPADKILCALLSHNQRYQLATLHTTWEALSRQEELSQSRFVLIPKSLLQNKPMAFAWLVKLALLNGRFDELKTLALKILEKAEDAARKRLDAIDIYELDQIVFRSSIEEGVWEPDTLFRIFGLFHREETRQIAKRSDELYKLADDTRAISMVSTESFAAPGENAIAIQRLERDETADFLNNNMAPIELGDIFQKTGDSGKLYILLAQSCDLMVRSNGRRNSFTSEVVLAEIVPGPIKERDRDGYSELEVLDENSDAQYFVSFKRTQSVKLSVLDMCALNEAGEASLESEAPCPEHLIPAWKLHYEKLMEEVGKTVRRADEFTRKGIPLKSVAPLLARCSNVALFTPTIDLGRKKLSFNVKRVMRLRQPRAGALSSRYANFMARQAFEHDFAAHERPALTEITEQAVLGGSIGGTQQGAIEPEQVSLSSAARPVEVTGEAVQPNNVPDARSVDANRAIEPDHAPLTSSIQAIEETEQTVQDNASPDGERVVGESVIERGQIPQAPSVRPENSGDAPEPE